LLPRKFNAGGCDEPRTYPLTRYLTRFHTLVLTLPASVDGLM
jgi:hypothetical protein